MFANKHCKLFENFPILRKHNRKIKVYIKKQTNMKKALFSLFIAGLTLAVYAQSSDLIIPSEIDREQVIHHNSHSLSYSSAYVMPSWISYKITNSNVNESEQVKGKYIPNPLITSRSASKKDYKDCGYLMAQLANYADLAHIDGALEESFYMSNIVPMKMAFYKHMWLKTEQLTRLWLRNTDGLYIICGPINEDAPFKTFGNGKVSIPKRYYKVVYDAKNNKAIGFIFKNGVSSGTLKSYSYSIGDIEKETGINFFPNIDTDKADAIKSSVDYDFWLFEIDRIKF